jgi:hypothetical protein
MSHRIDPNIPKGTLNHSHPVPNEDREINAMNTKRRLALNDFVLSKMTPQEKKAFKAAGNNNHLPQPAAAIFALSTFRNRLFL